MVIPSLTTILGNYFIDHSFIDSFTVKAEGIILSTHKSYAHLSLRVVPLEIGFGIGDNDFLGAIWSDNLWIYL